MFCTFSCVKKYLEGKMDISCLGNSSLCSEGEMDAFRSAFRLLQENTVKKDDFCTKCTVHLKLAYLNFFAPAKVCKADRVRAALRAGGVRGDPRLRPGDPRRPLGRGEEQQQDHPPVLHRPSVRDRAGGVPRLRLGGGGGRRGGHDGDAAGDIVPGFGQGLWSGPSQDGQGDGEGKVIYFSVFSNKP